MANKKFLALLFIVLTAPGLLFAQMEKKRAVEDKPVEDIFLAGSIVGTATVSALPAQNLNFSVMHNFGLVSGGIDDFFGLDLGASIRLGLDYGLTDRLEVGIGRSSLENNVDARFKYVLLQQLESDKMPLQLVLKGDIGINTEQERRFDFTFTERLNYLASVMIARKFNDKLSVQIAPMVSHFNTVVQETEPSDYQHTHFGVGLSGRYKWNNRNAITFEYLPVISNRNSDTTNHLAAALEIDTGGHIFQLFFMTGQWFTEQHLLTRTNTKATDFDFRLGFNINRLFSLGS